MSDPSYDQLSGTYGGTARPRCAACQRAPFASPPSVRPSDIPYCPEMKALLKATSVIVACAGALLALMLGCDRYYHAGDHISADLICLTNHPPGYLAALVRVTNQSDHVIWCRGYGFLVPGESGDALITSIDSISSIDSDRIQVRWKCADPSKFDAFMNRMRRRAEVLGIEPLLNWFPLTRVLRIPLTQDHGKSQPAM